MSKPTRQLGLPGFGPSAEEIRESARDAAAEHTTAAVAPQSPASLAGQTVWGIDAHSLIHQVFHAMPEMAGPRGQPVGAVFGFTRDLLELIERKPDFLFCAFDLPGKTFRHQLYPHYKAERPAMHEDLQPQIPVIRQMLSALGIAQIECPGYEADDILATLARQAEALGAHCVLVTNDKDCRQLISDHCRLYNIRKGTYFDRQSLLEEWGIRPDQVVDFQALVGDPVDQIPGVPLVGPKIARQLLEQYGSLDNILDHAHQVSGTKRRENLIAARQQAMLSRQLVRLEDNVPIAIDWNAARLGRSNPEAALALCDELGFRSLAGRIRRLFSGGVRSASGTTNLGGQPLLPASAVPETNAVEARLANTVSFDGAIPRSAEDDRIREHPTGQREEENQSAGDRFGERSGVGSPHPPEGPTSPVASNDGSSASSEKFVSVASDAALPFETEVSSPNPFGEQSPAGSSGRTPIEIDGNGPITVTIVDTPQALAEFVTLLRQQKRFSIDTETTHVWPRWAEIVGLSFAWEDHRGWYLPLRAPEGERRLDASQTLDQLRPILEDAAVAKIGQNLKYDRIVLRCAGIELRGADFDTMIADYLLDSGSRSHSLDALAHRYLNHSTIRISELIGTGKNQKRMDEVPVRSVADYAGEDAVLPWRLAPILKNLLDQAGLLRLFEQLEMPLIDVLVDMEYSGMPIDVELLTQLGTVYQQRLDELHQEIIELAGHPLNIDSPKQLQHVLFDELKLPRGRRTQTGNSTDAETLEELARLHPLPAKILEYRQYAKLKGTYIDALPRMAHPRTGRVHSSFNQVVTATGRLSSNDPNLQNIPVRGEAGREIRAAFTAGSPGWLLLAADYSQIELRVLAHFSGDPNLCQAFARGEDIHAQVAARVFGVGINQVDGEMRRRAKAVNFGIIYGQGPVGLARALGIDRHSAAEFIDSYFAGYPGIERFLEDTLEQCRRSGYARTLLGRRRPIEGVRPSAGRHRNLAERTAVNTVIQGSAADIIKLAMLAVRRRLQKEGMVARLLLQIHDELLFESPPEEIDRLAAIVAEEMAGVIPLAVPLKVDVKVGPNWADMISFDLPKTR